MAWEIEVVAKELSLTKSQANQLVDILEKTWGEFESYLDWLGGVRVDIVKFFTGPLSFIDDFMEHRDYLGDTEVQKALLAVGAEGFVTFADFEGDERGCAWTHTFKNGAYGYAYGKVRQLVDGKIVEAEKNGSTIHISNATLAALTPKSPFEGNSFVITGEFTSLHRRSIEEAIENMGGRATSALSGKTFALLAGEGAGPAKLEKAKANGTPVWTEALFLSHAGLAVEPAEAAPTSKIPYGWHFEEYRIRCGEVVNEGFSRTDPTGMKSKTKGYAFRFVPLYTA